MEVEVKECKFIHGQLDHCLLGRWTMLEPFLLDPVVAGRKMSKK